MLSIAKSRCVALVAPLLFVSLPARAANPPAARATSGNSGDRPAGETPESEPPEHFRVGPLFGIAFPRPLAIEALAKFEKVVGVGLEYSLMPRTDVKNVNFAFNAIALDLRVFPFRGMLFFGLRAGRQWLDANARLSEAPLGSIVESMNASTWFVNPRVGFLYTFGNGITLGMDAGIQLPIAPSYVRTGPAAAPSLTSGVDIEGTLVTVANALGNSATPSIDLLRAGFLF